MTDNIIELNKESEQFVLQAGKERSRMNFGKVFGDKYMPLTFVHASDMHAVTDNWNRMVEYVNYYKDYIGFFLHTGDYCGGDQTVYKDLYAEGDKCEKIIYQTNGNHENHRDDHDHVGGCHLAVIHDSRIENNRQHSRHHGNG